MPDPTRWSRCLEPGCHTLVLGGPRVCTPHAEAQQARGHRFQRESLAAGASPLERMVYLATEPPYQRCRRCRGRRSLHVDDDEVADEVSQPSLTNSSANSSVSGVGTRT